MAGMVSPYEGYHRVVAYGKKKATMSWHRLIIQGFFAGFWISLAGHISSITASAFYIENSEWSGGVTKWIYGAVFPIAFMMIIFTSAELYTGNTMAMAIYALHTKKLRGFLDLLINWSVVLVTNYGGAIFGAFFFSYLTHTFSASHYPSQHAFLGGLCKKKLGYDFGIALIHAIGCNIMVCLTTFATILIDEPIGKIAAIWFLISAFCYGNFEHIIANFYTLSLCNFVADYNVTYGDLWTKNYFAVLLGNTIAGGLVCGLSWWFLLGPTDEQSAADVYKAQPGDMELGQAKSQLKISNNHETASDSSRSSHTSKSSKRSSM